MGQPQAAAAVAVTAMHGGVGGGWGRRHSHIGNRMSVGFVLAYAISRGCGFVGYLFLLPQKSMILIQI